MAWAVMVPAVIIRRTGGLKISIGVIALPFMIISWGINNFAAKQPCNIH